MSLELAVLIPVYQDQAGVVRSLEALRAARWPVKGTVILVDDGSNPALEIRPGDWAPLSITQVRLSVNQGIEAALNAGLEVALKEGVKYIARLDAGDTLHKERLAKQIAIMDADPAVGIVASDVNYEDEDGHFLFRFIAPLSDREIRRKMHIGACLIHPAVMLRACHFKEIGNYSKDYPAAEDYELFFRFLAVCRAQCIPEALTGKTVGEMSISVIRRREQLKSKLRIQLRYFDVLEIYSFVGIAMTLLLFAIPRAIVLSCKRMFGISRI